MSAPKKPLLNRHAAAFPTSVFFEMSALAAKHGAINLGQGFPDFAGPEWIKDAACRAIADDHNQYAVGTGTVLLRGAIAAHAATQLGRAIDPDSEITVTSGATEALFDTLLGMLNPGDESILFEPMYDSYEPAVVLAGATARHIPLRAPEPQNGRPEWWFDADELAGLFNERTKLVVLNTPHNPTGKVFTRGELELIAELCQKHDAYVIADEVYEHLYYDDHRHICMASLPGMWDRTITVSSSGKTFSLTGWKLGWTIAKPELAAATRKIHQFVTFASPTPLQHGMAVAFAEAAERDYYTELRAMYQRKRDYFMAVLAEVGLRPYATRGTYFILCDIRGEASEDIAFCKRLTTEAGVAAVPPSFFYSDAHKDLGRGLARFAFCKNDDTLAEAASRLRRWRG